MIFAILSVLLAGSTDVDASAVDRGAIADAVDAVLAVSLDAVRVAVPPVEDANAARAHAVELALVEAILERKREEVITPAYLKSTLLSRANAQERGELSAEVLKPFAADHLLLARVLSQGGRALLELRLVHIESGRMLESTVVDVGVGEQTSVDGLRVRNAAARMVEEIAAAVESTGVEVRTHRIAIAPWVADEVAKRARLDDLLAGELAAALVDRGFLVVERAQISSVLEEQANAQLLAEERAPDLGKMLGASSIVLGSVAESGTTFSVSLRVVSTEKGALIGATQAQLRRDDVVQLAAVETRTPLEAALLSVVAPGWGQSYNGEGGKALVFAVGGYGGLLTTAGLALGAVLQQTHYEDATYFQTLPADTRGASAEEARSLAVTLYTSSAIAGGATALVWALGVADAAMTAAH